MQKENKQKLKEKVEEVYPIKNTLLNELRNPENKKYIQQECLTITYRKIEKIEESGIPGIFLNIPYVHLSHNKINNLKGIQQFYNLKGLSISHNLLNDWTELLNIPDRSIVQFLRVRRNPLCKNPNYHSKILEYFQNLEKLDDIKIDDKCHQIKYQTQHISQPFIMQLFKLMQIEFEKIEQKMTELYPHLFDKQIPTSQKMNFMISQQQIQGNDKNQFQSINNILGDLSKQKPLSVIHSQRQSAMNLNIQQNVQSNRSNLNLQNQNTSIANITIPLQVPTHLQIKNQPHSDDINYDFIDHLIAFLNNDPTLKLKKSASSILLGGFFIRLWKMLGNYMLDPFYKNMMNIYDLQIDLFSRLMKKYREKNDQTLEQFLQAECDNDPDIDKERLFSDLDYGYACFFNEMFKLSEPPVVEEFIFLKDHLGIIEKQPNYKDQSFMNNQQEQNLQSFQQNNQSQQALNQQQQQSFNQQQNKNQQQQSINQFVGEAQQQGVPHISTSLGSYPQTFASYMSQSVMDEQNKEHKKVNSSQNQVQNQQDQSPKNTSYIKKKSDRQQQEQQQNQNRQSYLSQQASQQQQFQSQQYQQQQNANHMSFNQGNSNEDIQMLQNYFPLFLLNQEYMEIVFECVVEKLVGILHGYELLMFGALDDDNEVFYKFQNVQKVFTIYSPQQEIFQSIQNLGKQQAINESKLANQSRTKSEKSINDFKRRQSANQSALSQNDISQNQKSRFSIKNIQEDGDASQSRIDGRTNMSLRSQRQGTNNSIGSRKGDGSKERSNSVIDQLNNTLNRLNIKRGHANSMQQNRSALNLNQNTTYQQQNQSFRQGILPDLSPINQLPYAQNANILNTSQNQTANNMSKEYLFQNAADRQHQNTLPLNDYSPINQGGGTSQSQRYQNQQLLEGNSPFNIMHHTERSTASLFGSPQNQNSKGAIYAPDGTTVNEILQPGQVGTSYFTQDQNSKDSIVVHPSFNQNNNQQESFSRMNQSKSMVNQSKSMINQSKSIGNIKSQEYSTNAQDTSEYPDQQSNSEYISYRDYVLRQQMPWYQSQLAKKSLQKAQYFVTVLKNILEQKLIPRQKQFFLKLRLSSDRKYDLLYNILQRRMKIDAFKFWQRQMRKMTKNDLFNLMTLQKYFGVLRKNVSMQKVKAIKHNSIQIKYKVFFGLAKILKNKRKIRKGLRKIKKLVLKKAILPTFQKLALYYFILPIDHTVEEISYNKNHEKSRKLFNQISLQSKLEDAYKKYESSHQNTLMNSFKSQLSHQPQKSQDAFKLDQIDQLNNQSRIPADKGILHPNSMNQNPQQNLQQTTKNKDNDNTKTIKPQKKGNSVSQSTIKDKTIKQNKTNQSIINKSKI